MYNFLYTYCILNLYNWNCKIKAAFNYWYILKKISVEIQFRDKKKDSRLKVISN